jgi:hypothetical protein
MKNSTKFKIIQWVTKLLGYYPPQEIHYETIKYDIITVKIESAFPADGEMEMKNNFLRCEIPNALDAHGVLEFNQDFDPNLIKPYTCSLKFQIIKMRK